MKKTNFRAILSQVLLLCTTFFLLILAGCQKQAVSTVDQTSRFADFSNYPKEEKTERPPDVPMSPAERLVYDRKLARYEENIGKPDRQTRRLLGSSVYIPNEIEGEWQHTEIDGNADLSKGFRSIAAAYDKVNDKIYVITYSGHLWRIDRDEVNVGNTNWVLLNSKQQFMFETAKETFEVINNPDGSPRLIRSYQHAMQYSDDEGATWTDATGVNFTNIWWVTDVQATPTGERIVSALRVGNNWQLVFSTDGASYTASSVSTPLNNYEHRLIAPTHTDDIYLLVFDEINKTTTTYKLGPTDSDFQLVNTANTPDAPNLLRAFGTVMGSTAHLYFADGNVILYSDNEGASWTTTRNAPYTETSGDRVPRTVDPDFPNNVFRGYIDLFVSTDRGATFNGTSHKLGWDVWCMEMFTKSDGSTFHFVGDDFGILMSYTPTDPDSYITLNHSSSNVMCYDGTVSPIYNTNFVGTQDRGSFGYQDTEVTSTVDVRTTDGLRVTLANDEKSIWTWMYFGTIYRKSNFGYQNVEDLASLSFTGNWWSTVMVESPDNTEDAVYIGGYPQLKKFTYQAATITQIDHPFDFSSYNANVSGFGYSKLNRDNWYVSLENGQFFYSTNGGTSFTESSFAGAKPTAHDGANWRKTNHVIKTSPTNANRVYYAGVGNVFLISDDNGATFTNHANGLDVFRFRDFTVSDDDKYIFAACAFGGAWVYSVDADQWYEMFDDPIPFVDFTSVRYNEVDEKVHFFSYGYGEMTLRLLPPCPPEATTAITSATCSGTTPNNNAQINLTAITGDVVGISPAGATSYTGPAYDAAATDADLQLVSGTMTANFIGLMPGNTYWVRVFDGSDACVMDYEVMIPAVDCNALASCTCTDYIYLNDDTGDLVHKFAVDPTTGSLMEIGNPWLSGINAPHGLAGDLNGFLYIGEASGFGQQGVAGDINKISCDGVIVETDFLSTEVTYAYNYFSVDGVLYMARNNDERIRAYSLCDGTPLGDMAVGASIRSWGIATDGTNWYLPNREDGIVYSGSLDLSLYNAGATNSGTALFATGAVGGTGSATFAPMGITLDAAGNIYIVFNNFGANLTVEIRKYAPNGTLLATITDSSNNGNNSNPGQTGLFGARGITFSEASGFLYVSNFENCVTVFNTNLVEQTGLNIGNPTNGQPKGISVATECCPPAGATTISNNLCGTDFTNGTKLFLAEYSGCNSAVCGGGWTPVGTPADMRFEVCDNSITIEGPNPCGTFTLAGGGPGLQCESAFNITVVICFEEPIATPATTDATCNGETPNNDAQINLSAINGDLVGISSAGATGYDGSDYDASATASDLMQVSATMTTDFTGLMPGMTYWIRVFNGSDACVMDYEVMTQIPICLSQTYSLGSTVFIDNNNNGMQDAGESGIAMVTVQLFDDNNNEIPVGPDGILGTADDGPGGMLTNGSGDYFFQNLPMGNYVVQVAMSSFGTGAPLEMTNISSTPTTITDNETDNDDNGIQSGAGFVTTSPVISLGEADGEPTGEAAQGGTQDNSDDIAGDMTVDFGFFQPVSLGDTTFVDLNENGLQDPLEPPLPGVTVTLYDSAGNLVTTDAEGNPLPGATPGETVTNADGFYEFTNLPPGNYYVVFDISTAPGSDFYAFTSNTGGDEANDSDADPTNGQTDNTGAIPSGGRVPDLDAGVICTVTAEAGTPQTICSTTPLDLADLGASFTPTGVAGFGATWTSSGTGTFDDSNAGRFGVATTYTLSEADALAGQVTLTLTTDNPANPPFNAAACGPAMDQVIITILQVDCGTFPWGGN